MPWTVVVDQAYSLLSVHRHHHMRVGGEGLPNFFYFLEFPCYLLEEGKKKNLVHGHSRHLSHLFVQLRHHSGML